MYQVRVLLFGANRPWTMKNEDTGEIRKGCKVRYIPLVASNVNDGSRGFQVVEKSLNMDLYSRCSVIPGVYDLACEVQYQGQNIRETIQDIKVVGKPTPDNIKVLLG